MTTNAMQFDGTENGMWDIADKIGIYQDAISFQGEHGTMICHTLKGDIIANNGDWIIKNKDGEVFPCEREIVELLYGEVIDEHINL